ncbi:MAG TPA: hypothetical protein VGQ08_16990 [Nitrospiraceae bacterium]|jgi:hypothetical protein|nr:hypothetical protein [Nitrospiraceae bacterium]
MKTHTKKQLAYIRRWKRSNPDKVKTQRARWRKRHPAYLRNWRQRNPKKVKAYKRRSP